MGQVTSNPDLVSTIKNVQISASNAQRAEAAAATVQAFAADLPGNVLSIIQTDLIKQWLMQWALSQAFQLVSATRDTNEAIIAATIVWPDGARGVFTTDSASVTFPGAIDAWHATYVNGSSTYTITQPTVTRDVSGAVIVQPAITIQ